MDENPSITVVNDLWRKKQGLLSKEEIKYIANQDTLKRKMRGFLTKAYYQRSKLIKTGSIVYGFVFKEWTNDVSFRQDPLTWVLFSPERKVAENPSLLEEASRILLDFCALPVGNRTEKKLKRLIKLPLSEATYFELPSFLTKGHLIYLSIVQRPQHHTLNFKLGLNYFIFNPIVSKEIIYLPDRYHDL